MKITNYLHTAIVVTDLAKSEQFYGTVLGLEKVQRELKFPGAWYQLGNFQLHLIVSTAEYLSNNLPEKWGRGKHIAFAVENLELAKQELLANDCPLQMSASGRAALFTQDPDGNVIELSDVN